MCDCSHQNSYQYGIFAPPQGIRQPGACKLLTGHCSPCRRQPLWRLVPAQQLAVLAIPGAVLIGSQEERAFNAIGVDGAANARVSRPVGSGLNHDRCPDRNPVEKIDDVLIEHADAAV